MVLPLPVMLFAAHKNATPVGVPGPEYLALETTGTAPSIDTSYGVTGGGALPDGLYRVLVWNAAAVVGATLDVVVGTDDIENGDLFYAVVQAQGGNGGANGANAGAGGGAGGLIVASFEANGGTELQMDSSGAPNLLSFKGTDPAVTVNAARGGNGGVGAVAGSNAGAPTNTVGGTSLLASGAGGGGGVGAAAGAAPASGTTGGAGGAGAAAAGGGGGAGLAGNAAGGGGLGGAGRNGAAVTTSALGLDVYSLIEVALSISGFPGGGGGGNDNVGAAPAGGTEGGGAGGTAPNGNGVSATRPGAGAGGDGVGGSGAATGGPHYFAVVYREGP